MRLLLLVLGMLLSAASLADAADKWTDDNTLLQGILCAVTAEDLNQTLWMCHGNRWDVPVRSDKLYTPLTLSTCKNAKARGFRYIETNAFLGAQPSEAFICTWFFGSMVANCLVAYLLPKGWRELFQYASIFWESVMVTTNNLNGIRGKYTLASTKGSYAAIRWRCQF